MGEVVWLPVLEMCEDITYFQYRLATYRKLKGWNNPPEWRRTPRERAAQEEQFGRRAPRMWGVD